MPDNSSVTFVGAFADVHGRNVQIYQDHDGVRMDVAGIEIMLTSATAPIRLLAAAQHRADDWGIAQAALNA